MSFTTRLDSHERNLLLNGGLELWQRGTSFTATTGVHARIADRFSCWFTGQTATNGSGMVQVADVPILAQSGWQGAYSLKVFNGSAIPSPVSNDYHQIQYTIEGYDYQAIHGRKVRLQFWLKSSITNATYSIALQNNGSTRSYVTPLIITGAGWQFYSYDIQLDNAGTWAFDNNVGLTIFLNFTAVGALTAISNSWQNGNFQGLTGQTQMEQTANAFIQITQAMLIPVDFTIAGASSVVVPFQRCGRSFGHEVAMCQRYCETSHSSQNGFFTAAGALNTSGELPATYWNGTSNSGTLIPIFFRTEKRATPAGGASGPPTFRVYANNSGTVDAVRDESGLVDRAVSYSGNGTRINSTGASIYVPSAITGNYVEFHWICDVEF